VVPQVCRSGPQRSARVPRPARAAGRRDHPTRPSPGRPRPAWVRID